MLIRESSIRSLIREELLRLMKEADEVSNELNIPIIKDAIAQAKKDTYKATVAADLQSYLDSHYDVGKILAKVFNIANASSIPQFVVAIGKAQDHWPDVLIDGYKGKYSQAVLLTSNTFANTSIKFQFRALIAALSAGSPLQDVKAERMSNAICDFILGLTTNTKYDGYSGSEILTSQFTDAEITTFITSIKFVANFDIHEAVRSAVSKTAPAVAKPATATDKAALKKAVPSKTIMGIQTLIGMSPATGIWTKSTDAALVKFIKDKNPRLEGPSVDAETVFKNWKVYASQITRVEGKEGVRYEPNAIGLLRCISDIIEEKTAP
jgi:hypothetical protein